MKKPDSKSKQNSGKTKAICKPEEPDIARTRKTKSQKDQLWKIYKQLDGKTPARDKIMALAKELKLSVNQVYKWFWDTNKKVEEDNELAQKIGKRLTVEPVQMGVRNKTVVLGTDGNGESLTP